MPKETCWICGGDGPLEMKRSIVGTRHMVCKTNTGCEAAMQRRAEQGSANLRRWTGRKPKK